MEYNYFLTTVLNLSQSMVFHVTKKNNCLQKSDLFRQFYFSLTFQYFLVLLFSN